MNPERFVLNKIDKERERRVELSPTMERAYAKAKTEVLSNPDYSIQEADFAQGEYPVYDAQTVASDISLADRLERTFDERMSSQERNSKKIADTLEAIVLMESEMSNWFGDATTYKTSRFDDYVNKVDMISEWSTPETGLQVLALAVDVTFGTSTVEKKMAAIREEIDRGRLGSIRYFKDSRGDFMGTRNNVPRTVIGISQPVVEQLSQLWLENDRKSLSVHPIQRVFVSQVGNQLNAMYQYALKRGNHVVAQSYKQATGVIRHIGQNSTGMQLGELPKDPVWIEIAMQTRNQFKT